MRKARSMIAKRGIVALVAAAGVLGGCEADRGAWTPVLESTPPSFLEREVDGALADVRAARSGLGEVAGELPEEVAESLDRAGERLEKLSQVYLPLYRAKVAVTNAYRRSVLGETNAALRAVEEAEEQVVGVNRATEGVLEAELDQVVEPLADAQLALEGGSDARAHLERAAETLDDLLTRAGLLP